MAQQRIWFAEDIAHAMERLTEVRDSDIYKTLNPTEIVAGEMGINAGNLKAMLGKARESGFSLYPSRAQ